MSEPKTNERREREMKRIGQTISAVLIIALVSWGMIATAQSQRPYRATDRAVEQLIRRIENRADRFKMSLDRALDRSRLNNTRREDNINQLVMEFEQATNQLRNRFNQSGSAMADAQAVLDRAAEIDRFMSRHRLQANAERNWRLLKGDLNQLARTYNIAWDWNSSSHDLTGTYRLNSSRSGNARLAVERAVRRLPFNQRQRATDALLRRIEAPEMLALEKRGRMVTLASSRAPQVTFDADGREHVEQYPNRRVPSQVRAVLSGDQLNVNSTGDRATDFSVTFDPINNGQRLRVTRRVYAERLSRPVVVQSIYDRTSDAPQWGLYMGGADTRHARRDRGEYIVPGGTTMSAQLNTDLNTRTSRAGDRFTLSVSSPAEFRGATIEGYVGDIDRSGRLTGRTDVALNLAQIQMPDGRVYPFEGVIESVRTPNGETLNVNAEGAVRDDDSQTGKTVERTAIGSAVGAIIGALAGGGKGAAIGAAVGAGAGAGSVYVQGRDHMELPRGTDITVQAIAP
jgi:hypothetical protein